MKDFIDKMLDLGVTYSMACSEEDRNAVRKSAQRLYKDHMALIESGQMQPLGEQFHVGMDSAI